MEKQSYIPNDTHSSFKSCPVCGAKARTEKRKTFLTGGRRGANFAHTNPNPVGLGRLFWRETCPSSSIHRRNSRVPRAGTPVEPSVAIVLFFSPGGGVSTSHTDDEGARNFNFNFNLIFFTTKTALMSRESSVPPSTILRACWRGERGLQLLPRRTMHARSGNALPTQLRPWHAYAKHRLCNVI